MTRFFRLSIPKNIHLATRLVLILSVTSLLASCMAMVASIGTPENEIIDRRSTLTSLTAKLGEPLKSTSIDPPYPIWSTLETSPWPTLLVDSTRIMGVDGTQIVVPPKDLVARQADFVFVGVLKRAHDVGEAASLSIMTLGTAELFTPVYAMTKKRQRYILTVYFDQTDRVLGYRWSSPTSTQK